MGDGSVKGSSLNPTLKDSWNRDLLLLVINELHMNKMSEAADYVKARFAEKL